MIRDYSIENLKKLAEELEIRTKKNESEHSFRSKLAVAVFEHYHDTIWAAEILFGKNYHDFDEEEQKTCLGMHFLLNRVKEAEARQNQDTYYNMGWKEYQRILFENKFDNVLVYDFKDTHDKGKMEEYSIWARKDKGLLLTAESYGGKESVNSTNLYFELSFIFGGKEPDEIQRLMLWDVLEGASHGPIIDKNDRHIARSVSADARFGLVSRLSKLEKPGIQTNNPWQYYSEHFLWLLDYSETKEPYDSKAINAKKVAQLPLDVQIMIGARTA